jgi:hypothetical protein
MKTPVSTRDGLLDGLRVDLLKHFANDTPRVKLAALFLIILPSIFWAAVFGFIYYRW